MKNRLLLTLLSTLCLSACSQNITRIENELFPVTEKKYQNIYPGTYQGRGPHHAYDDVDFLLPTEKKTVEPGMISFAHSGIDKTFGFDYEKLLSPTAEINSRNAGHITWLGHASFLIQKTNGDAFVTDPVFGEFDRYGWVGSKVIDDLNRLGDAPIKADQLDFVTAIMVSHNHYDHLNSETLNRFNGNTALYLPLDTADDVNYQQGPITEMGWYTQTKHSNTDLHFLPANHTSSHGAFDTDESLWGSWLMNDGKHTVYFAGDTGYSPIFKDIQQQVGDIDVCLMPIVAYPRGARKMHMSPEDAVQAALDLGCKVFIPWGYGTWALGFEHVNEPLRRLATAVQDMKPNFTVKTLLVGESVNYAELLNMAN
ncbi:MBL fold metallo-hydrolase [Pseudoalteromonas sp. MMG013]|uniref:MBL fold metallo-hydrolase n=1 Tax=Pseudoalteromonas sp. MMG013 TaxID=2822687 RepID=UPI001B384A59|nr:MBL fold metallo-hydrolase [Pseudoalteromonas sp. MMG013]MBQ4861590.1 MBL fold metallo-hydrolase [Pseudoalteromonas sp. MMG013]